MRNCILLLVVAIHLTAKAKAQQPIDSIQTIYEYYKDALDNNDTIKRRAITYGSCAYESLTQIIKKNDSTLIINNIITPCLKEDNHKKMPPLQDFDYLPYSIEVPINALNYWNYNIKNTTGKISVINLRRNLTTKESIKYEPYSKYDMNFLEFIEFAITTNKKYRIYDYICKQYVGNNIYEVDVFSQEFKSSFGDSATFFINHMWGVHITTNFIVIIENVQNGMNIEIGKYENDERATFIKIAESIKSINPNSFDLRDLINYH